MSVVWALTWLVRSAALAALTAAFVRLPLCRASAAARHVAWTLSFFLCAGLLPWPLVPAFQSAPALQNAPGRAAFIPAADSLRLIVLTEPVLGVAGWLGLVWTLGAVAGLVVAGVDVWRVMRLKARTVALTAEEQARLDPRLSDSAPGRAPRLAWCDDLDAPAVLGFSRPVIALPRSQMSSLSDEQSRLVVLHEVAHVRRRDDWWALAERIVLALTWVNPAAHFVHRELRLSREMACDQWVVRRSAAPLAYAKSLADVAGLRSQARRLRLAAGVSGRAGTLRRRIIGVLALSARPPARAVAVAAWLAPVAVCVVGAGLSQLPPLVTVEQAEAASVALDPIASPDLPGREAADLPPAAPVPRRTASPGRQAAPARRLVQAPPAPVRESAARRAPGEAHDSQVATPEERAVAAQAPMASSPLPGTGAAGVIAAEGLPAAFPSQAAPRGWWSRPVELGRAAGGAAAGAGRATASVIGRFGSRVPQRLTP